MKKNPGALVVAGACVVVLAMLVPALAQQPEVAPAPQVTAARQSPAGVAEIPFEFYTTLRFLPPGRYELSTVGPTHLLLRNLDDAKVQAELFTLPDPTAAGDMSPKLIFLVRGERNYLVGLRNADGPQRLSGLYGLKAAASDVRKEIPLAPR